LDSSVSVVIGFLVNHRDKDYVELVKTGENLWQSGLQETDITMAL